MSCCYVTQCCCGCTNLKVGVIIWAIIDAIINLSLTCLTIFVLTEAGVKFNECWPAFWWFGAALNDFFLVIGVHISHTGLIQLWQVDMMINIVILFITAFILVGYPYGAWVFLFFTRFNVSVFL